MSLGLELAIGLAELEIDGRRLLFGVPGGTVFSGHLVIEVLETECQLLFLLLERRDGEVSILELLGEPPDFFV